MTATDLKSVLGIGYSEDGLPLYYRGNQPEQRFLEVDVDNVAVSALAINWGTSNTEFCL